MAERPSFKRAQSTMPSLGGLGSTGSLGSIGKENSMKDDIQVILHEKRKILTRPEEEIKEIKEEDENRPSQNTSLDLGVKTLPKLKYENSGPYFPPKPVMIQGAATDTNIKPKRVLPKLHEKIASNVSGCEALG